MIIFHDQLTAVNQMSPGLFCQIGMFKVRSIVPSRRKDHGMTARITVIHGGTKKFTVIPVILNGMLTESLGWTSAAEFPRDHGIGCAGRHPQVVLQNEPAAIFCLYQIDTGNMAVNSFAGHHTLALCQISAARIDKFFGNYFIPNNLFFSVNIFYKKI